MKYFTAVFLPSHLCAHGCDINDARIFFVLAILYLDYEMYAQFGNGRNLNRIQYSWTYQ